MANATALRRWSAGGRLRWFWAAAVASVVLADAAEARQLAAGPLKVQGEVLDEVTGAPVAGVVVHFPDLGLGTITDALGYFAFDAVPRGAQVLATHRTGYAPLLQEVPVVGGETWVLRLAPVAFELPGIEVAPATGPETEAATIGRRSDFISPSAVAEAAERTSQMLEVLRAKAPPRLRIRQKGGLGSMTFCIESSRRRPSVQELMDLGAGCRPALLALDGVIVYAPPAMTEMAHAEPPSLPADVAALLLSQNPQEIRSIRVLSPADAFFRYGDAGRSGAVEIVTVHPGRPKGS